MGKNKANRVAAGGLTLFFIGLMAFVPFSNCSQNPQNASTPKTAFLNPEEKLETLKIEFQGRVSSSFCQSNEAYGCMQKVYSPDALSSQKQSYQECLIINNKIQICPMISTFHFNSSAAQENCNGCQESYEYIEYSCHLKIPNSENIYPIVSTNSNLEHSLLELHEFCVSIAEDSK